MQRLIELHPLRRGAHPSRDDGMCAMEMVAWLAGEAHSDEPSCACPVLSALVRACNDAMNDQNRDRFLRPLVPQLVNSRGSPAVESVRGFLVVDAAVRTFVPVVLRRRQRPEVAKLLAGLTPVTGLAAARAALRAIEHWAEGQHAASWVLRRAIEGTPPARYVAGVVQLVRSLGDQATWALMVQLLERMVRVGSGSASSTV